MTTRGKVVLTVFLLGIVGFGVARWWDKIAPQVRPQSLSINVDEVKKAIQAQRPDPASIPLLAGTNPATLVERLGHSRGQGSERLREETKDGKLIVKFPINVWPGWAPIIVANAGLEPSDHSVFYKKHGFYVKLAIVDDPVKARDLFASGKSHVLWGTLDMIALFAPD